MHPDAKLYPWNFIETYKIKFITKFIAREIYAVSSVFLRAEGGPNCEVTLLAEVALPRSTALLRSPTNPTHPPTTLAVQAAPEFNSNETNKHKISCAVIQAISKFNISHKADPRHAQGASFQLALNL